MRQGLPELFASFSFLHDAKHASRGQAISLWSESRYLAKDFVPTIRIRTEPRAFCLLYRQLAWLLLLAELVIHWKCSLSLELLCV